MKTTSNCSSSALNQNPERGIEEIEFEGIDPEDHPDYVDAFISSAVWSDTGVELSEEEIEAIPDQHAYEYLMNYLF